MLLLAPDRPRRTGHCLGATNLFEPPPPLQWATDSPQPAPEVGAALATAGRRVQPGVRRVAAAAQPAVGLPRHGGRGRRGAAPRAGAAGEPGHARQQPAAVVRPPTVRAWPCSPLGRCSPSLAAFTHLARFTWHRCGPGKWPTLPHGHTASWSAPAVCPIGLQLPCLALLSAGSPEPPPTCWPG